MIILDSSFLVALEVEGDKNHARAVELNRRIIKGEFGKTIISDYIFDETITVTFGRTKSLEEAILVGNNLLASVEMKRLDDENFEDSWDLFKKQKLTKFSFTDCTTLSVMKEGGIRNIATFDDDFKKVEGINVVGLK